MRVMHELYKVPQQLLDILPDDVGKRVSSYAAQGWLNECDFVLKEYEMSLSPAAQKKFSNALSELKGDDRLNPAKDYLYKIILKDGRELSIDRNGAVIDKDGILPKDIYISNRISVLRAHAYAEGIERGKIEAQAILL